IAGLPGDTPRRVRRPAERGIALGGMPASTIRPRCRSGCATPATCCSTASGSTFSSRRPDGRSVAALLLDPRVEHRLELVAGAANGLFHVLGVVAGAQRVVVLQPGFERTALVLRAALGLGVGIGEEDLDPAQAREVAAEMLFEHGV